MSNEGPSEIVQAELTQAVKCPSCGKLNDTAAEWCWVCRGAINATNSIIYVTGAESHAAHQYLTEDARRENDMSRRRGRRRAVIGTGLTVIGGTLLTIGIALIGAAIAVLAVIYSFFAAILEICSGG